MNFNTVAGLLSALIMFWAAYNEYLQRKDINEILQNGEVVTAIITKMPDDCNGSYRRRIYAKVALPNGKEYSLSMNNNDCESMSVGEKLMVLYSPGQDDILRFTATNADRKTGSYAAAILLLIIGSAFFIYFIAELIKYRLGSE